jgi:hypothetical protein
MMLKRLFLVSLQLAMLAVLAACSKELDIELPYLGDKLVINGILTPGQVIQLRVSKTAPVGSDLTENLGLRDATVALYEDSVFRENLRHTEQGTYISPSRYQPVAGRSYFVRVSAEGFAAAETRPETVPRPVAIDTYAFSEAIRSRLNSTYPTRKLTLTFADDAARQDYYSIGVQAYYRGYKLTSNTYYLDKPLDAADPCGFLGGVGSAFQYNLTDICFAGATRQVNFGVETRGFPQADYRAANPGIFSELDGDQIRVSLRKGTATYYEYLKTANQPEGFFIAFTEPNVLQSNVQGGLGLLAAYSEYTVEIRL